jgi:hypothetical protein
MTVLSLLPALILWEEKEASSVPVTLDTLEMALPATILMSAVLVLIAVHSRQHVLTLMAVSFVPVILDTLAMELDALMLMSVN